MSPARNRARRLVRLLLATMAILLLLWLGVWLWMIRMPGDSHNGPLPALSAVEQRHAAALRRHVQRLSVDIGERNLDSPAALARAADYVAQQLSAAGLSPRRLPFEADGMRYENIVATLAGRGASEEVVVIGAHYDSAFGTPAANDNGSGTAALLVLAKAMATAQPQRSIRFVAFTNEEPPHFQTEAMGSLVYARACRRAGDRIVAMISLETMGYFRDEPGSQRYPPPFDWVYPDTGHFIGFVSDTSSRQLLHTVIASFRKHAAFPSEGAALPAGIPGVGWSDHWSFWQVGYPAVMVSDTAPFRYPYYHTPSDTLDKLDFDRLARVVAGLQPVIMELADAP